MTYAMAQCPVHGPVPATAFGEMGPWTRGNTYIGSSQTCPIPGCNRTAVILDATYTASPSGKMIATPATPLGEYQFSRLRRSLEEARRASKRGEDSEVVAANLQAELLKQAPEAAPVVASARQNFAKWFSGPQSQAAAAWLGVLIALIALFIAIGPDSIGEDQVRDLIEETVREYQQQEPAPASPTPSEQPPAPGRQPPILEA